MLFINTIPIRTLVAVAALVATGAFADVTLSGAVDQGYFSKTVAGVRTSGLAQISQSGSFLTFAGNEDLGSGLKASFKLEQGIGLNNGTKLITHGTDMATVGGNREGWIALAGSFGTLTLGNQYSNSFYVMAGTDPASLNNLGYGYTGLSAIPVASQTNTISYTLPTFVSGLSVTFQKRNATTAATGALNTDGTNGGTSIGAIYANGAFVAAVGADSINGVNSSAIGATYDLGVAKLHFSNGTKGGTSATTVTDTMFGISAPVTEAVKVAISSSSNKVGTTSKSGTQMGAYYALSKRTQAYLINGSSPKDNANITAVGINHAF